MVIKSHGGRLGTKCPHAVKHKEGPMGPINGHVMQQPLKEDAEFGGNA